jgi:hypothetical protein
MARKGSTPTASVKARQSRPRAQGLSREAFAPPVRIANTCRRFASIAVDRGFITPEQAKFAIAQQIEEDLANKPHRVLGAILVDKGWITHESVEVVLSELFPRAY